MNGQVEKFVFKVGVGINCQRISLGVYP